MSAGFGFVQEKHPWAKVRVAVNWVDFLAKNEVTILSSIWVEPTTAVTFSGAAVAAGVTSTVVEGGADGITAYVENRVQFSDLTQEVVTIVMVVTSKAPRP